jgi:hypothetical protein
MRPCFAIAARCRSRRVVVVSPGTAVHLGGMIIAASGGVRRQSRKRSRYHTRRRRSSKRCRHQLDRAAPGVRRRRPHRPESVPKRQYHAYPHQHRDAACASGGVPERHVAGPAIRPRRKSSGRRSTRRCNGSSRRIRLGKIVRPPPRRLTVV